MKKGITIIATAHYLYGRMAYNLALTIKATGTNIPVAVVCDQASRGHLSEDHLKIFDHVIDTNQNWNWVRFNIDRISPFDLTLQLDADMLWLWRDPEELFSQHEDVELLVTNEGYYDIDAAEEKTTGKYPWLADKEETIKQYKLKGKLYLMRWEALFFRKTETVRKMFKMAEQIRKAPKLETWLFEGQPVDEFAFYVACNKCGLDQKESPWLPAHWCHNSFNPLLAELNKNYFAVGFGGNFASSQYRKVYDHIMVLACGKFGLKHQFKLQAKNQYLTSRRTI